MREPLSAPFLLAGLAMASAGIEALAAASPAAAWLCCDLGLLWVIAVLATAALLGPAMLAGRWLPGRRSGLLVGSLALLHLAVALRFGPLVNHGAASPAVLGAWAGAAALCLGGGWWLSPRLDRLPPWSPWVLVALGPLGLGAGLLRGGLHRGEAGAEGPSVLLVTLDTARRDKLSVYEGPVPAPALEALAARGAIFEDAVAPAPQTGPSHLSILTGLDPLSHGVVANGTRVGDQPASLARALSARGWHTAAFVSGYPVHSRFGLDQGFSVYDDDFSELPGLHSLAAVRAWDAVVRRNTPRERSGVRVLAAVDRWLDRTPPEPWLAWVHLYDPHGPYQAPARFAVAREPALEGEVPDLPSDWPADLRAVPDLAWHEAQYEGELAWTDHVLGLLLGRVASEEVLVVVAADHGEHMTEHGVLFDHGDDLFDTVLRVPLVMAGPGVEPGTRVGCQVPLVDLAPTVLALVGVEDGVPRDGRSRAAELSGGPCVDGDAYAVTVAERRPDPPIERALRRGGLKLVLSEARGELLYDLEADPGEEVDRDDLPGAAALREALSARVEASTVRFEEGDRETRELLIELGYQER